MGGSVYTSAGTWGCQERLLDPQLRSSARTGHSQLLSHCSKLLFITFVFTFRFIVLLKTLDSFGRCLA